MNSIQFSDVKTSLLSTVELLDEITPRVLGARQSRAKRQYRTRRAAASLVAREVESAVRETVGVGWENYRRKPAVQGRLQEHLFDAAIENGQPLLAARGLSFEGPTSVDLEREIRVTAWALDDISESGAKDALAVIALPPDRKTKAFDEATHVFEQLGGEIVVEDDVHDWAAAKARQLTLR